MRHSPFVYLAALLIAPTFAAAAFGQSPESADAATSVWNLIVLDGKVAVPDDAKARRELLTTTAPAGLIPGTQAYIWTPATWGLQLGATKTPHVFHTYFGPEEGVPVPGDFNGDGLDELAVFVDGQWHLDFNGNSAWDADDLWVKAGDKGDRPVVGDWNLDGKTDIGYFTSNAVALDLSSLVGLHSPPRRNPVQTADLKGEGTGTSEIVLCTVRGCFCRQRVTNVYRFGTTNDTPVIGRWKPTVTQSIGTFRDGIWKLDMDDDGKFTDSDRVIRLGEAGDRPIVGDFNRDGIDELGVYRRGLWMIDVSGDLRFGEGDLTFKLGDANDIPVVGDWDGDGADQIGIIARGTARSIDSFVQQ